MRQPLLGCFPLAVPRQFPAVRRQFPNRSETCGRAPCLLRCVAYPAAHILPGRRQRQAQDIAAQPQPGKRRLDRDGIDIRKQRLAQGKQIGLQTPCLRGVSGTVRAAERGHGIRVQVGRNRHGTPAAQRQHGQDTIIAPGVQGQCIPAQRRDPRGEGGIAGRILQPHDLLHPGQRKAGLRRQAAARPSGDVIRKERERHGGGNGGIVRHQPRLIRLVVVRRDGKQTVTAGFLRQPGQRHGARGVVASRPGDHGNMPPRDALRLRPTAFLYREREQPELFLVGQRGRFPGRAAYHQRIHARGDLAPDKPDEGFVIHRGRRVSVARRGGQHGGDQRGGAPDEQRGSIRFHGSLLS